MGVDARFASKDRRAAAAAAAANQQQTSNPGVTNHEVQQKHGQQEHRWEHARHEGEDEAQENITRGRILHLKRNWVKLRCMK